METPRPNPILDLRTAGRQRADCTTFCAKSKKGECPLFNYIVGLQKENVTFREAKKRTNGIEGLEASLINSPVTNSEVLLIDCLLEQKKGSNLPCGSGYVEQSLLDKPKEFRQAVAQATHIITPDSQLVDTNKYEITVYEEFGHYLLNAKEK
jgi:hypothetical protein